ncbi:MAG: hypothetical protein KBE04_07865, partial [Phycisphaerae bacterium]|nr:hypothetical protein [Phycisphaerae bacterium]
MAKKKQISPEEHRRQIRAYTRELPHYREYADALERIFNAAFPLAVVQKRAKTISSFAEKCVRRFDTYPDAVHMLTDLCGARIIVQTLGLTTAVRHFIEVNFAVLECD